QVDDQLQLVEALEVSEARVVAGVDQRLETGLDELARAAAEDRLLTEEVGLDLVLEGRLDDAGAGAADPLRVSEDEIAGDARLVGVAGNQRRDAAVLLVLAADEIPGALRRDEPDIDARRRLDLVVLDRKAVGEHEQVAGHDPVGDVRRPDLRLLLAREQ